MARGVLLARGGFGGGLAAGGELDGSSAKLNCLFDVYDLEAGDGHEAGLFVDARGGCFGDHGLGWYGQGEKDTDPGFLAFDHAI